MRPPSVTFGLGRGARNLVIDGLFGLLALVARSLGRAAAGPARRAAHCQPSPWPSLAVAAGGFLARSGWSANTAALGVELVEGFGDAVEVEVRPKAARAARGRGPTTEVTIDSIWSFSRRSKLAWRFLSVAADRAFGAARAVGEQVFRPRPRRKRACGLRPLTAEATRWRIARTWLASSAPAQRAARSRPEGSTLSAPRTAGARGRTRCTAGRLHAVDRLDGAGKPRLPARAQMIDVSARSWWRRACRTCRRSRRPTPPPLGQTALGKLHADAGHAVARHQHDGAVVFFSLIGDRLALQVLHDRGGNPPASDR